MTLHVVFQHSAIFACALNVGDDEFVLFDQLSDCWCSEGCVLIACVFFWRDI